MAVVNDYFVDSNRQLCFDLLKLTSCQVDPRLQNEYLVVLFVHFLIEYLSMDFDVMKGNGH